VCSENLLGRDSRSAVRYNDSRKSAGIRGGFCTSREELTSCNLAFLLGSIDDGIACKEPPKARHD
jgi:hypothetical protein